VHSNEAISEILVLSVGILELRSSGSLRFRMLTVPPDDSAPRVVILSSSVKSHKYDRHIFVTFLKEKQKKRKGRKRDKNVRLQSCFGCLTSSRYGL